MYYLRSMIRPLVQNGDSGSHAGSEEKEEKKRPWEKWKLACCIFRFSVISLVFCFRLLELENIRVKWVTGSRVAFLLGFSIQEQAFQREGHMNGP